MSESEVLTAEQFADRKYDLPEAGRFHELDAGTITVFQPPDTEHGTAVFNLTRAIGEWTRERRDQVSGYACFEIGLIVRRDPDTVYSPAMAWFESENRFAETDQLLTETCPRLVVEVASTNDRRRGMRDRMRAYHEWGVELVWVIDPHEKSVTTLPRSGASQVVMSGESLNDVTVLSRFSVKVDSLFKEPDWWTQAIHRPSGAQS